MPPKPFEQETSVESSSGKEVRFWSVEFLATPTNVAPDSFVEAVVSAAKSAPAYWMPKFLIVAL